jgi:anti-anti-sigma factor
MKSNINSDKYEFSFVEDSRDGKMCRFTLKGQVSIKEASEMEHKLERAAESGCNNIIINMCFVTMFTSAGIRVVLSMFKKLKGLGGKLQIENPSESVRNVIGMTALDELLLK